MALPPVTRIVDDAFIPDDVAELLELLATGVPLPRMLDEVVQAVERRASGLHGSILLLDGDRMRHGSAPSLPAAYSAAVDGLEVGPSVGSCGTAIHRRALVVVEDIATDPLWADFRELALGFGLGACWSMPVLDAAGQPLATFALYYSERRSPEPGELRLIETAARLVRIALERDRADRALRASEERVRRGMEEQGALRRVATAVAREVEPDHVFALVAFEVAQLLEVEQALVVRFDGPDELVVLGSVWDGDGRSRPGARMAASSGGVTQMVQLTGEPARAHVHGGPQPFGHRIGAPIFVRGQLWGAVAALTNDPYRLGDAAVERLARFADLVSTSVETSTTREVLARLARTDPLTGLTNHRVFHERLREVVRDDPAGELSVVVLDIDAFKGLNDAAGHQAGDDVLRAVAAVALAVAGDGDVVARLGGDELALLLPGADLDQASGVAAALHAGVRALDLAGGPVTVSLGVCDLATAGSAEQLVRLADGALYWAKANGRDAVCTYRPGQVLDLSAEARAERVERANRLRAVQSLARAVDARDPATRLHSDRVAALASRLARQIGWSEADIERLREASLVHDIGKIAVPDDVLHKPGRLTAEEYEIVEVHAAKGAEIVEDTLDPEQVAWVRHHHERHDGRGYPDAIAGAAIPLGARILAVADSWDVMTSARARTRPRCRRATRSTSAGAARARSSRPRSSRRSSCCSTSSSSRSPRRAERRPRRVRSRTRRADGTGGRIRTLEPGQPRLRDFQSRSFGHSDTTPAAPGSLAGGLRCGAGRASRSAPGAEQATGARARPRGGAARAPGAGLPARGKRGPRRR